MQPAVFLSPWLFSHSLQSLGGQNLSGLGCRMKDAVICFRISKDLRRVLQGISETNRRSLSATIENILHAYAEQRGRENVGEERRLHPRKKISAPALLT